MSGDGRKGAGHDRGSSTNTINSKKVPQACSIELRKERRGSLDQSTVESSHNQDRPPTPDADGHPQIDTKLCVFAQRPPAANSAHPDEDSSDGGGSSGKEWFKMRPFHPSKGAAVVQGGAAAAGNTGSGQGTSGLPCSQGSKKESKN